MVGLFCVLYVDMLFVNESRYYFLIRVFIFLALLEQRECTSEVFSQERLRLF